MWLHDRRYRVPKTFVLPYPAYDAYLSSPTQTMDTLRVELGEKLDPDRSYAVRSSANVEDTREFSFAGQFRTELNIQGIEPVLSAIELVYQSTGSDRVLSYLSRAGMVRGEICMAVLIQEMVEPTLSGVAFSRNPVTGLNEVVIEAVPGLGESLVADGVTPERWTYRWGEWIQKPEGNDNGEDVQAQIAASTQEIAGRFGGPIDLEWVYDGQDVSWIQMRPITALDDIPIYSNRISKEFLPGLIKPLIWSVNVPLVNSGWVRLFTELIGPNDIQPEDLAKAFYYRAYFNMGTVGRIFNLLGFPRDSLELLMGFEKGPEAPRYRPTMKTLRLFPRILRFLLGMFGYERKVDSALAKLEPTYHQFTTMELPTLSEAELLDCIDQLFVVNLELVYHNILTPIQLSVYSAVLRRSLERDGIDFTSLDLTSDLDNLDAYDPNVHLSKLKSMFDELDPETQTQILSSTFDSFQRLPMSIEFRDGVLRFMNEFGHFSESGNDFSAVPWRENFPQVISMIGSYKEGETERSQVRWVELELGGLTRLSMSPVFNKARSFRLRREQVSSLYTYGYGLFRDCFLTLGDRFTEREILDRRDDVFYLYLDEIRSVVEGKDPGGNTKKLVQDRKDEMERTRGISLPEIIYGDQEPPIESLQAEFGDKFKGIPTSRGYYEGPIKVIQSLEQTEKLLEGDILVIPFSDVAWTPLFTRAGAVIAESGGILSHSSIVARELGIPCVVSVPNACLIPNGTKVVVDGFQGEISILES